MATLSALHHVGESLVFYLKNSYAKSGPKALVAAEFVQFGTGNLPDKTPPSATVGITLYRVGWNERSHGGWNRDVLGLEPEGREARRLAPTAASEDQRKRRCDSETRLRAHGASFVVRSRATERGMRLDDHRCRYSLLGRL